MLSTSAAVSELSELASSLLLTAAGTAEDAAAATLASVLYSAMTTLLVVGVVGRSKAAVGGTACLSAAPSTQGLLHAARAVLPCRAPPKTELTETK